MFEPTLRIPQQETVSEKYQGVHPNEVSVQNWLNQRNHMDLQAFLEVLVKLNRSHCSPAVRMSIMTILDVDIQNELADLIKTTNSISFPISEEYQLHINNLQQLLLGSSIAYQIVIHDIASNEDYVNQYIGSLIPEALFMAILYLSRLLVERFQFYLSEPKYFWQEINQLYLLAERIGAQDDMIRKHASVKNCYLQVAILKLLNPYRMMRLEARKIYHLMADWVEHCEVISYAQRAPDNHYVVDLLSDNSPHYYEEENDAKGSAAAKFEGRVITMDKLKL